MRQHAYPTTMAALVLLIVCPCVLIAADQPQWGEQHSRNMVSPEKGLPQTFEPGTRLQATGEIDPASTENVKWVARLGGQAYGTPVVAEGKVFVGTNNSTPRDSRFLDDHGVMMCFDEASGEFLWQLVVPKLIQIKFADWWYCGISSTPVVERGRVYLVSNRGEVMCLDTEGMANGNDGPYSDEGRHMVLGDAKPPVPGKKDADILWLYDMPAELGVKPHNASNCSVLMHGDLLYICTSNGVEWTHSRVANPEAPSLIVLDKNTGKLVARDNFGIGADVVHGQWSSPAMGRVGDRMLGFFGAGNGYLYGFEMLDGNRPLGKTQSIEKLWWINGHPLAQTQDDVPLEHCHDSHSYEVVANPVFYKDRVYVTFTQEAFHKMTEGWLTCIDATKTGDITRGGIIWSYDKMGAGVSTVSIVDGLLYVADFAGRVHCLDAENGDVYWVYNAGKPIWGSTLVADGKVYIGTGRRTLSVLAAGKKLKELSKIRMRDKILCSPVAANGTLYIATDKHLYAVGK
jgi:outer membrane protein assembly factor BamB